MIMLQSNIIQQEWLSGYEHITVRQAMQITLTLFLLTHCIMYMLPALHIWEEEEEEIFLRSNTVQAELLNG